MPPSNIPQRKIEPPKIVFSEDDFQLDSSEHPVNTFIPYTYLVYGPEGRGKSSFLKSVATHWGNESILAIDVEKRLKPLGVPRLQIPEFSEFSEGEHYARIFAWWDIILDRAEKRQPPFNAQSRVLAMDTLDALYVQLKSADLARKWESKGAPREQWLYDYRWYTPMYDDIMKRVNRMMRMTKNHGYHVVFICHAIPEKIKIENEDKTVYSPVLPPGLTKEMNFKADIMFFLKAATSDRPNYFVTRSEQDTYPAKDGSGQLPKIMWPTWAALEAAFEGRDPNLFPPKGLKLTVAKKEDVKSG